MAARRRRCREFRLIPRNVPVLPSSTARFQPTSAAKNEVGTLSIESYPAGKTVFLPHGRRVFYRGVRQLRLSAWVKFVGRIPRLHRTGDETFSMKLSGIDRRSGSSKRLGFWSLLLRAALPLGILCAGGVGFSILSVEPEELKSAPAEVESIRTRVTELHLRDYPVVIRTQGVVQPHNEVILSAEVSGLITKINPAFEVGSYFSAGEVLVELDARDYLTASAVAKARFDVAQAALKLAIQNHDRNLSLAEKNVVSEAELDQSEATRVQAGADLDSAAAQLEQAQLDRERTKIRAPFDGRVRRKMVGLGQSVSAGTPLGDVFAIDYAEVRLPIAGRELKFLDLPELADDAPVAVELRDSLYGASGSVWEGKIVRTEGALDENSLELYAIARIDDPFGRTTGRAPLRMGQPVSGSIAGKVLTNVVALPRSAVRQLDQVLLVDKTELTLSVRTIDPIWSDEEYVIVQGRLIQDGGWLSTTHIVFAPDGAKVEIIRDPEVELTAAAISDLATEKQPVTN